MLLFLVAKLFCTHFLETQNGTLYLLNNDGPHFILNIHDFGEKENHKNNSSDFNHYKEENTNYDKTQIALASDNKNSNIIRIYEKPKHQNGYLRPYNEYEKLCKKRHFFDDVFLGKSGNIIFKFKEQFFDLKFSIFDILKEPKIINNTILTASKKVNIQTIENNIIIFIIMITLQITDIEFSKNLVYSYIYSPFENRSNRMDLQDGVLQINEALYDINGIDSPIDNVYTTRQQGNIIYLENIYKEGRVIVYNDDKWKIYPVILITIVSIILISYLRKDKRMVKIKSTVSHHKNYQIGKGIFDGGKVMVKIYQKDDLRALNEITVLKEIQKNNIIKYFCQEIHKKEIFLILEHTEPLNRKLSKYETLRIANLIYFLQKKNISYNNLCFENLQLNSFGQVVLMNFEDAELLTDKSETNDEKFYVNKDMFRLANSLHNNDSATNYFCSEKGTKNWRSPEIILGDKNIITLTNEMKLKADIFSLGMLLYYNETNRNPFDINSEPIEENILRGEYSLKYLNDHCLHDLICHCLNGKYQERMNIKTVVAHPYFWNNEKKFNFIANLSDFLENKSEEGKRVFLRLERNKNKLFQHTWSNSIDTLIENELKNFRFYNLGSVKGLLRAIRNKGRHYKELPEEIKAIYGNFPDGYMNYYIERFPSLLMVCHYSAKCSSTEEMLKVFYE